MFFKGKQRHYEETGTIGLKPALWVLWKPQSTPGQPDQEEHDKETQLLFSRSLCARKLQKDPFMLYTVLEISGTFCLLFEHFEKF